MRDEEMMYLDIQDSILSQDDGRVEHIVLIYDT